MAYCEELKKPTRETRNSRSSDSSDANVFPGTTKTVPKDGLQAPTQQARRRASLIPQRTTSIKSHDVSRPQPRRTAPRSERNVAANIKAAGLQRSQSTKRFEDLKQHEMPGHHRLSSLSCLASEKSRNGPATRSGSPSFSGKRQSALPSSASTRQIALVPIYVLAHAKTKSADGRTSIEAEYINEEPKEAAEKSQDVDNKRRLLTSDGNPKLTHSIRRLEAINATTNVPSADRRLLAVSTQPERPAFSTLQQDFGPKQTPSESRSLIPPHSPDCGTTNRLSPEALASNLELLQLHMLNRSSSATRLQWESSAEKHYRVRFDGLASDHDNMTGREMILQEQVNASAIIAWGSGTENLPIGSKIQKLSRILTDVVDVSHPSGQYTCLLDSFEHWYSNSIGIRQLRGGRVSIHPRVERTLEGIGDGWKAEADNLKSKLLVSQEELVFLGEAHPRSDLTRCLDALLGMLTTMLEEIDVIQAIETRFLHEEENWLKDSLGHIAADLSNGMSLPVKTERHR
ncbi:hypothetical protein MMC18_002134 [Xylographa bjoerkii]|nr:hypothetical protein [Xylographa bjoerkii]